MPISKKRKLSPPQKSAIQQWEESFEAAIDDEVKLEIFLQYIDAMKETSILNFPAVDWIKTKFTAKLCSFLSICPKEENENPVRMEESPFFCSLVSLQNQFKNNQLSESMNLFKECQQNMIKEFKLPQSNNSEKALFSLLAALDRLHRISTERNLGELVVSGAMGSLFDVICSLKGDTQNGTEVLLDEHFKKFYIINDGILQTREDYVYCRREDTSLNDSVDWEEFSTDAYKLIISMKSQLKLNMNNFSLTEEEVNKYSKVLGLCYTKAETFAFILSAKINKNENGNITEYSLYFKRFDMKRNFEVISLFVFIMQFITQYVPLTTFTTLSPFKPTCTPNNQLVSNGEFLSDSLSSNSSKTFHVKHGKAVLETKEDKISSRVNYLLQSTSFLKKVNPEEKDILTKLISNSCYCIHLPQILNVYKNDVEFEKLHNLPSYMTEKKLIALAIDISIALNYLHSHSIIHRDVKPDNIMTRTLNDRSTYIMWFVLIDFGLSIEYENKNGTYYCKNSGCEINENLGTNIFKAPEVTASQSYTEKCDIYSLGASVMYLKNESLFLQLWEQDIKSVPTVMLQTVAWEYKEFGDIIKEMIADDPKTRPSAEYLENRLLALFEKIDEIQ